MLTTINRHQSGRKKPLDRWLKLKTDLETKETLYTGQHNTECGSDTPGKHASATMSTTKHMKDPSMTVKC